MYRVMIIDDEKSIRNLLKITINWEALELEIVGEAASGIEAINTIDELRPDIVFVDIRMPFMDGIEFSKLAIKRYPLLKIIVLTAFDEFEYARTCIGIGVTEYLLKPIVRDDINEACKKVVTELKKRLPEKVIDEVEEGNDFCKIKDYIKINLSNSDLNLTSIAQEFGFNPSYLSRRFKADMGINLIDYLTKCRIELAIEYARNNMLMYIAAKRVGIPDPNYFGKCFKKYTGKSYTEMMKEYSK
jgi:YesN/AraC family two-component response regulator